MSSLDNLFKKLKTFSTFQQRVLSSIFIVAVFLAAIYSGGIVYFAFLSTRHGGLSRFSPAQYNLILLPEGSSSTASRQR